MQKQVIEFAGVPVGIVIPDDDRLKFIAVKFHVHDLDEQHFDSPANAPSPICWPARTKLFPTPEVQGKSCSGCAGAGVFRSLFSQSERKR